MAKSILVYTSGTLGDHLPFIALAEALAGRGHRVRMAVNVAMREHVARAGLNIITLDEPEQGAEHARRYARDWNHWDPEQDHDFTAHVEPAAPVVRQLLDLSKDTDLLITTSIRPWGRIVQQMTGVPWLSVALVPAQFHWPDDDAILPAAHAAVELARARYRDLISGVLARLGIDGLDPCEAGFGFADEVLLASSRHFSVPCLEAFGPSPPTVHTTGFIFFEDADWSGWAPNPALANAVDQREPPIVLSYSSQPLENPSEVLAVHARAAAALKRHLIVQAGWAGFDRSGVPADVASDGITFVDYLPHDWLFSKAACVVQHGGIGSIARALRQGCPVLIEPYGNDQFFNALRVVELGVGAAMNPAKLTPEGIVRVLEQKVLTNDYRRKARTLGSRIRRERGLELACKHIEARLS